MNPSSGRPGRFILSSVLVPTLLPVAVAAVSVAAAPAASAAPPAHKTLNYTATLSTAGQSMYGPAGTTGPTTLASTFFDQSWSASGGFDEVKNIAGAKFGAALTVATSGRVGLSGKVTGLTGGTVAVNYPTRLQITGPSDQTFAPGDTVQITTSRPPAQSTAAITAVDPTFTSAELDGVFGIHASADGRVCLVTCASGTIFDVNYPSNAPSVSGKILGFDAASLPTVPGLGPARCFGSPESKLFGTSTYQNEGDFCRDPITGLDSGYVSFPRSNLGSASTDAGGQVTATGGGQYVVLPVSGVKWLTKVLSPPSGFPSYSVGFHGVGFAYTLADAVLTAVLSERQTYTFTPTVNLSLAFGTPVHFTVRDTSGRTINDATGATATFPLGDTISITVPHALTVVPTLSMGDAKFRNHTVDTLSASFRATALTSLSASIKTPKGFPDININVGPVYDTGDKPVASTDFDRYDRTWQLRGFNAPVLAPFTLVPDLPPTGRPATIHPVAGSPFSGTVATFADPDPAAAATPALANFTATIAWGDGTTSIGMVFGVGAAFSVLGSHTYSTAGSYPVSITVQKKATPTVRTVVSYTALVGGSP